MGLGLFPCRMGSVSWVVAQVTCSAHTLWSHKACSWGTSSSIYRDMDFFKCPYLIAAWVIHQLMGAGVQRLASVDGVQDHLVTYDHLERKEQQSFSKGRMGVHNGLGRPSISGLTAFTSRAVLARLVF